MYKRQLSGQYNGYITLDLSPFTAVAGDTTKLIDAVDQALSLIHI